MAKTKKEKAKLYMKEYKIKKKIKELERKYKTGFFPESKKYVENLQSNQKQRELKLNKSYFNGGDKCARSKQ